MKKKILIVTECFYPEEFKINEVAIEWQKRGYEVAVLTSFPTYPFGKIFDGYKNSWYKKDSWNGITIYRVRAVIGYQKSLVKKLFKYFSFMFLGSILSLKVGKKYDYIFGFNVGSLTGMLPAVILKKFYKKPVTLWVQDVWPDSVYAYGFKKTKLLEFVLDGFVRFIYNHTSGIAISGEGFHTRILPYVSENKKIVYAPNWADSMNDNYDIFSFSKESKKHFTFAGNIGTVQNLDNVIKAFGCLEKEYLNKAQLNIIGDGSHLEELKKLVIKENIANIVFWGRKPREDIKKYFQASDFLIVSLIDMPIFTLTVPAKLQTYISVKKPILAILEGDTAHIVEKNNLGFCAKPNDLDGIKDIFLKSICLNEKEKKAFTVNCSILSEAVYNKEKIIDKLLVLTLGKEK